MKIILKFIIKSIKDNKFRTFLILISIILSSALYFASSAISGTLTQMYITRIRQYYGNADILIYTNRFSPDWTFYIENAQKIGDKFDYVIGDFESYALYKIDRNQTYSVNLKGIDLADLEKVNPISIYAQKNLQPFTGKKIIISKIVADRYNLKLDGNFDIEFNGERRRFTICGIAQPVGLFQDDARVMLGIIPKDTLAALNDRRGKISVALFKLKNPEDKNKIIAELTELFPLYTVREPYNEAELREGRNRMTVPFMMMTTLILLVSVFIIYSSFKVITMERLPVIGTFRSIGAAKKTTDLVLIIESLAYGIIGGVIGCMLGIAILYAMSFVMGSNPWDSGKMEVKVYFDIFQILSAFFLALVLSLVSSIIPIIRISKIPVKDIVLNKVEKEIKVNSWKTNSGIVIFAVSVILPVFTAAKYATVIDTICIILSVTGVILLIPVITNFLIGIFEKAYLRIFGNEGLLAAKNLRENKSILNNITLLAIGISTILMINTASYTSVSEVARYFQKADFQIWLWFYKADRNLELRLKTVDGVTGVFGSYSARNVEVRLKDSGKNGKSAGPAKNPNGQIRGNRNFYETIKMVHGIDKEKFNLYWKFDVDKKLLDMLGESRNIIFSYGLKSKFSVGTGDVVRLVLNNEERSYRVIGFFYSLRDNGNYALVADKFLKLDTGNHYYEEIYLKTSKPPDEVVAAFKKKFGQWGYWISTMKQMKENEEKSYSQLFTILKSFSILTLVIGIFGVLNNFIISFIERKRHLAIFRSVGMSKKQIVKMIFIEALTGGLIGGVIGVILGLAMLFIVEYVMRGLNMYVKMNYSFILFVYAVVSGVIITVFASISPALKSSKLNIIEAIKYE